MSKLSQHFSRSEFACQCGCGFDTVDIQLLEALENVREYFKAPVTITSGCRCESHNYKIGGASDSQHTKGRAADFKVQGKTPQEVHDFLCRMYPDRFGIGLYDSWVHFDSRSQKARWKK